MTAVDNLKYRQKVLVLLSLIFIFISSGLYVVYETSRKSLLNEHRSRLERTTNLTTDRLRHKVEEMEKLVNLFQSNRPLTEYLYIFSVLGGDRKPFVDMLRPMFLSLNVNSLVLYGMDGKIVLEVDTKPGYKISDSRGHGLSPLPEDVMSGFVETYDNIKVAGLGPLRYMGKVMGYISVGSYIDGEYLSDLKASSGNDFILVKDGKVMASTFDGKDIVYKPGGGSFRMGTDNYSVYEHGLKDISGKQLGILVIALPNEALEDSLRKLRFYIFSMLGVSALLSLVFSLLFIKTLVNPLNRMTLAIGKVSRGEFGEELEVRGKDEIAILSEHFNYMQKQLKTQRQKLEHYAEDLEGAVKERTMELKKTQQQLLRAQKMDSLGTLASGIAHDFNNLLSAILGYASFVKEGLDSDHPHYRYWDIVEQAALRGTELTNSLLTFSGGRVNMEKKRTVDVNGLIQEVVRLLGRTFDKSISIKTVLSPEKIYVSGDANSLYQALLNICINSRDAMRPGDILTLETAVVGKDSGPPRQDSHDYVVVSITDTGTGMKKDVVDRIFEPFFSTKEAGRGTGLGLSIVYGIIQKHNGLINVYSEEGKGTTFKIYLPSGDGAEIAPEEGEAKVTTPKPGSTIMVVDDDEPIRIFCREILESAGYKVVLASSGAEALDIFGKDPESISFVVLDMIMTGISGHETFKRIKALDPDVRAVITSGFSPAIGIWEGEEGIVGFIQKPFRAQDFLNMVNEALADTGKS